MTHGPLPPHERAWRHPSELSAPQPEPPTRLGRVLILATATISLLLVGALALQLAPRRSPGAEEAVEGALVASTIVALGSPLAAAPTTSFAAPAEPLATEPEAATRAGAGAVLEPAVRRPVAALRSAFGFASDRSASDAAVGASVGSSASTVMITPLAGGLAVTTRSALGGADDRIAAVVPSGGTVIADVVHSAGDIAYVVIVGSPPDDTMAVADGEAATDELFVIVDGSMVLVEPSAMGAVGPPEGAPVVNGDGALVGLCTYGPDGFEVVPIGTVPEIALG